MGPTPLLRGVYKLSQMYFGHRRYDQKCVTVHDVPGTSGNWHADCSDDLIDSCPSGNTHTISILWPVSPCLQLRAIYVEQISQYSNPYSVKDGY